MHNEIFTNFETMVRRAVSLKLNCTECCGVSCFIQQHTNNIHNSTTAGEARHRVWPDLQRVVGFHLPPSRHRYNTPSNILRTLHGRIFVSSRLNCQKGKRKSQ